MGKYEHKKTGLLFKGFKIFVPQNLNNLIFLFEICYELPLKIVGFMFKDLIHTSISQHIYFLAKKLCLFRVSLMEVTSKTVNFALTNACVHFQL